jgi:hypothetical protein
MNRRNIMKTGIAGFICGLFGFARRTRADTVSKLNPFITFSHKNKIVGGICFDESTNSVILVNGPLEGPYLSPLEIMTTERPMATKDPVYQINEI